MVFSRLFFIYIFLPVCLGAYFLARGTKMKNNVLLLFSLAFYAWGEPVYVLLMLLSAVINYTAGRLIGRYGDSRKSRITAGLAVFTDIALLGVFKYSGFIVENINHIPSVELPVPDIRLPIGISFYTFQTISHRQSPHRRASGNSCCMSVCSHSWWPDLSCGTALSKKR